MELRESNDGSSTLYNVELNETYHSVHGAIQEAKHVFISAGLIPLIAAKSHLNLLEVGFGTGLNALLTFQELNGNTTVNYIGIEKYPLGESALEGIN